MVADSFAEPKNVIVNMSRLIFRQVPTDLNRLGCGMAETEGKIMDTTNCMAALDKEHKMVTSQRAEYESIRAENQQE